MIKLGICNEIFEKMEWEEICKLVSSFGYQGIEIAPFTFANSIDEIPADKRKNIKLTAEKYNLEIIGLHWLLAKPEGLHIISPDEKIRQKTKDYFIKLIDFCSALGGKILVFGSPKQRYIPEGMKPSEAWELCKNFFNSVLKVSEEKEITICIEPLSRVETNLINKSEEAIKLVEEINNPYLKMMLDVKAMSWEGEPIPQTIENCKRYLHHFHANDENRKGPGFGKVDFSEIIETLKKIKYNGYISVEVFDFSDGPLVIAKESINYLRKFL